MLRASSLGLAFTHGISRCYLLHSPRGLHKRLGHESRPISSGAPHLHTPETTEMSQRTSDDVGPLLGSSRELPLETMASEVSTATALSPTHASGPDTTDANEKIPTIDSPTDSAPSSPLQTAEGPRTATAKPRYTPSQSAALFHHQRLSLYEQLAAETDMDAAWQLYLRLFEDRPAYLDHCIPHKYLHTFAAALVAKAKTLPPTRMRTQTVFLRLLSVLNAIYYSGGQLRLWEWNALIDCAGRGWRKTRPDDFQAALNVYRDMVANRAPGSSFASEVSSPLQDTSQVVSQPVQPDVVTYTTLIAIAGRTLNPDILRLAESHLVSSDIPPNRVTFLAYLRFYARKGRVGNVRSMMLRVLQNGWSLNQDGTNALIWAYGRQGRLDVVTAIYRVLRHHLRSEDGARDDHAVETAIHHLETQESISIPPGLKPDAVTYYTLIQVYAYHGRLRDALDVFSDMMTSPVPVTGALKDFADYVPGSTLPNPVLPIFRSLFLGFVRHAAPPDHSALGLAPSTGADGEQRRAWTLEPLLALFGDFVQLPGGARPSARTVYWLLVACAITSGYNRALLRGVWARLEGRYGARWDGRVHAFREKIFADEYDAAFFERLYDGRATYRGW